MASARLTDIMPDGGLLLQKTQVMSSMSADQKARNAFKFTGIIVGFGTKNIEKNRLNIDQAVAQLLERGCKQDSIAFYNGRPDGRGGFLPYLIELRATSTWSSKMPWPVFAEFIYRLAKGKMEWEKTPQYPFDVAEHSATARQIEVLMERLPDFWHQCQAYMGSPHMMALHARENLAEIQRGAIARGANWDVSNSTGNAMESTAPVDALDGYLSDYLNNELSWGVEAMTLD